MSSDWSKVYLQDVANEITVGFVGSMTKEYQAEGIPFLRSLNVNRFRINNNDLRYVSKEFHKKISKSRLTPGDVVIVRTGKPGTAAVIPDDLSEANCSDLVIVRCGEKIDNKFLCYFLNSSAIAHINAHLVGAVQQHFNVSSARTLEINLPPLKEQKAIAHILGTLDEKIELNKKNNKTLEEISKALFKSWFINFDPLRAKAEGRSTGLPDEISNLFPDSFEDSELGFIPEGWEISKLGDLVFPCGESIKSSKEINTQPYVPIDCITSKSLTLKEYKTGSEAKSSLIRFRKGDILFGAMRPYFHKVCIAPFDGITRSTCIPLRQIEASFHAFSTLIVSNKETIEYATQNSTGSTIPYIKWKDNLENMKIIKPPKPISKCFDNIIVPILEKFCSSIFIQKNLIEIRDALLPKLISGELKIPDAEKMIEEIGI